MIEALLFDLDGTLIDSDPIHIEVFTEMLGARGMAIDAAYYHAEIHGRLNADIFAGLFPGEDAEAMSATKEAEYRRRLEKPGRADPAVPGGAAMVARARAAGWKLAVVTNAPPENAPASLDAVGLARAFDTVVASGATARGKPAPDPYLEGMRRLGVTPQTALAFEDSASGIASARAAGLTVVGIATSLPPARLRDLGCALAIADFNDPALESFLAQHEGALT